MKAIIGLTLLLVSLQLYTQNNIVEFQCSMNTGCGNYNAPGLIGGLFKPENVTSYTSDPNAYFPILIVYVQFPRDPGPDVEWWPRAGNQPPTFMGDVIAEQKLTNSEWWNTYNENTETLSDFWMEASRGTMHLVGKEVHVILPHEVSYYDALTDGKKQAMEDVMTALQNDPDIIWPNYDLWKKENGTFIYGQGDGFVDMLYFIARSNPPRAGDNDGYFRPYGVRENCTHGADHTVYNSGGVEIKIRGNFDETGSGFQISPGHHGTNSSNWVILSPMNHWSTISFTGHEHGHYLFGAGTFWEFHQQYSKVNIPGPYHGYEEYFSPYELLRLGYQTPQEVNFTAETDYPIGDFVSFSENSQMLKVPIGNQSRNEFFIIANRQHTSKYDHLMWGDTARGDPYRILHPVAQEYGKGVYIYHAYPGQISSTGYPWGTNIDIECADGLYNWTQDGYRHPDWSDAQNVEYYKRINVVYSSNDNGGEYPDQMNNHDGLSVLTWFGLGKKHAYLGGDGTDRYWTNYINEAPYPEHLPYDAWTSREWQGDRWDAWKVGYNEVFSPYSSPSTVNWDNQQTGIFIYLETQNGPDANLKIYKVGESGTEAEILQATPPAKPMNLKSEFCYQSTTFPYYNYNRLTWNHNLEPDMRRVDESGGFSKRYRIYRTTAQDFYTYLPDENNYQLITTLDIDENTQPSYIDLSNPSGCTPAPDVGCPPVCWTLHAARYRVVAVDVYETPSVKSDFASASIYTITGIGGGKDNDYPLTLPEVPKTFTLLQNYPNPFNPSTDIKFELPQNAYVSVRIYNALGEEVALLVNNEWKTTGRYSIKFDGSNLASGIYFYSIKAGNFSDTKKMVLIK